jgi:hypothetical protein
MPEYRQASPDGLPVAVLDVLRTPPAKVSFVSQTPKKHDVSQA